jgi:GT2 family glycosyltransferase
VQTSEKNPHVSIIILNWNTWQDTIECLESVFKLNYDNYRVILFDNGSENDSIQKIKDWADGEYSYKINTKYYSFVYPEIPKPIKYEIIDIDYEHSDINNINIHNNAVKLMVIRNQSNLGFAIANNVVLKILEKEKESDYYFLLNNDTVIHPDAVIELINSLEKCNKLKVAQSVIYSYDIPNKIANAGGKILFWGQTKYYKKIKKNSVKTISFINGCALMINTEIIQKFGLLSEKFFFGEEDFEFSMRMNKNKNIMISVAESIVYHKIGTSKEEFMKKKKQLFLHGINRLIDCKDYYSPFVWNIWKEFMLLYYFFTIILRHKFSIHDALYMINELRINSRIHTDVKKKTLELIFSNSNLWKNN